MEQQSSNSVERFEKYGNVMIDIETLSTHTNAVVIEVAAVEFNKVTGEIGEVFHQRVKNDYWFLLRNRHIDPSILKWWMQQSEEARKNLIEEKETDNDIITILELLNAFIIRCDNPCYEKDVDERTVTVWGNGSTFDISILQNLYEDVNILPIPWKFWAVNDVRTIVSLNPKVKENCKFEGTKHCAVDDCKHQIKYLSETLRTIHISDVENGFIIKEDKNKPYYLSIKLPAIVFDYDCVDFPWENYLVGEDEVVLKIDLKKKKLLNYTSNSDFYFFMKIVDSGKYALYNKNAFLIKEIEGYVPNKLIPRRDGYGDYIEFSIDKDGTIEAFDDYEKLDFSEFNL